MSTYKKIICRILEGNGILSVKGKTSLKPYVYIGNSPGLNIPSKGIKTKVNKGSNPIFNELFTIEYNPSQISKLIFQVYDKYMISKDDQIGEGTFFLETLTEDSSQDIWLPLEMNYKNTKKENGKLHIEIKGVSSQPQVLQPSDIKDDLKLSSQSSNVCDSSQLQITPGFWFPIDSEIINVGLGWDFDEGEEFDLDASIIALDNDNNKAEIIYYGHKEGFNNAIYHHGDNLTGVGDGDDEVITVKLQSIPEKVKILAVLINSYKRNSIIKAKSAFIRLFKPNGEKLGIFSLSKTKDCIGLLLGLFIRQIPSNEWYFRSMIDPLEGNTAVDSFSSVQKITETFILGSSKKTHPTHPLNNEIVFSPKSWFKIEDKIIYVGLGWDFEGENILDLDSSIISFGEKDDVNEIIYFKNTESKGHGIIHKGDNMTGEGEGDDEVISIDFQKIGSDVKTMAVVVNSFKGISLTSAKTGYVRLFSGNGPIGCYPLTQGYDSTGLLLGIFKRIPDSDQWFFQVMIEPVTGNTSPDSASQVLELIMDCKLEF